ncbi:hypothetical protein AGMMS49938_01530 [Fibrobacterales bacterium]|nr:hypothetical protein AGMMS49938_01530 [Fibrobacterales bacterium]
MSEVPTTLELLTIPLTIALAVVLYLYFFNRKKLKELEKMRENLVAISITDSLTEIANRRHFDNVFSNEYKRHSRTKELLTLIMIDIDHFKRFNDDYGHVQGDKCLKAVAKALANEIYRAGDLVARYGGEEFIVLLPQTNIEGAVMVAERMRRSVQNLDIPNRNSSVECKKVTASFGVFSQYCTINGNPCDMVQSADEMLYKAKAFGRNVVFANPEPSFGMVGNFLLSEPVWSKELLCGHDTVDAEHHGLFLKARELYDAMQSGINKKDAIPVIEDLFSDLATHFRSEEEVMHSMNYPELKFHAEEHKKLLTIGSQLFKQYKSDKLTLNHLFMFVVYEIIQQHIIFADKKIFNK